MKELFASKSFEVRFSEVDSMGVVWHGAYPLYLEDARECFGLKYGLGYNDYYKNGYYAPIVELNIKYKKPIIYGMNLRVDIKYVPTESAKVVFDYEIHNTADNSLIVLARSVQVFMNKDYTLVWENPAFYEKWKKAMGISFD